MRINCRRFRLRSWSTHGVQVYSKSASVLVVPSLVGLDGAWARGQSSRYGLRENCERSRLMFVTFFQELKQAGVPVTLREYLTLMQAMDADLASRKVEDFYFLSRATLVKDERNLDKFDRVFGHVFKGLETLDDAVEADIPSEWLKKLAEKYLTEEE